MTAKPGDWLLVLARTDHSGRPRRGEIVSVADASGAPPYEVHWLDTGSTSLVFPGPDAVVVNAKQLAQIDRRAAAPLRSRRRATAGSGRRSPS